MTMSPRDREQHSNGNLNELVQLANVPPKRLESVADVEITMTLGELLEETSRPDNWITWTEEDGLEFNLHGHIRPGKKTAIGGMFLTLGGIVAHTIYTHFDTLVKALNN